METELRLPKRRAITGFKEELEAHQTANERAPYSEELTALIKAIDAEALNELETFNTEKDAVQLAAKALLNKLKEGQ